MKFPSIIQVPGNPLDLALAQSGTNLPGLVVSLDSSEGSEAVKAESLNVYELTTNEGKIAVGAMKPIADGAADSDDADIEGSAEEIKRILYGIESLRKVRVDFEGDAYADGGEGAEDENE